MPKETEYGLSARHRTVNRVHIQHITRHDYQIGVGRVEFGGIAHERAHAIPCGECALEDTTLDHRPTRSQVLTNRDEAEFVKTAKRGQIGCDKGSVEHVEVFRMVRVRTSIPDDLDPQLKAKNPRETYARNCENPD